MNDSLGTVIAIMKMLSNNRHGNATFSGISDRSARTGRREVVENLTIWSDRKGKTKEANMKKTIVFSLMFLTVGIIAPSHAEANMGSAIATTESQYYGQRRGRRWNRGRVRSVIRTRIVWRYGRRYRETYRITYLPNGRTRIQVISRVRVGGYRRY